MRGCYLLFLKFYEPKVVKVGRLGELEFYGCYVYVGSGMNNVIKRVERHFRREKALRWHIDYLTVVADEMHALVIPSDVKIECELARFFATHFEGVKDFGCSDCDCYSHLFHLR